MNILITGATGLVGKEVCKKLQADGHHIRILKRNAAPNSTEFEWDIKKGYIDENAFTNIDAILHLAGATIGRRWTASYKKELYDSRIASTRLLKSYCEKLSIQLKCYISASGISYYGTFTSDKILSEKDPMYRHDFIAELTKDWELAADEFSSISQRVIKLRISPVLSKNGGSFEKLKSITNYNLACGIGSGKQWFNWIHLEDLVELISYSFKYDRMNGAYNVAADEIPTQRDFMKTLAKEKNKFFFPFPIPSFILKIAMGEMSEIALKGTRVSNEKLKNAGFSFKYPKLKSALDNLLK